jgi:hypothetical protein
MREGSGQGSFAAYQLDPEGLLAMVGMPNGENEKGTYVLDKSAWLGECCGQGRTFHARRFAKPDLQ